MKSLLCNAAVAMPLLFAGSTAANAAELLPPLPFVTAGLSPISAANATNPVGVTACAPLPAVGPFDPAQLTIRNTAFPDVGPYTVTLPGYGTSTSISTAATFSYRPSLVTAAPGDSLRFDLVNQLTGGSLPVGGIDNLHTHGLIVSPRPCAPLGDYIYAEDQPNTTTSYRIDIPQTLPGQMFGSFTTPQAYPSGLNWFHAHLHGWAHDDVMGGQSGLIYVGNLLADLIKAAVPSSPTYSTLARTDIRYLGLRDIQLHASANPDNVIPGSSNAAAAYVYGANYNTGLCQGAPFPTAAFGYCTTPAGQSAAPSKATGLGAVTASSPQPNVWMFTVNGQYAPTITLGAGRHQIWRIANLSASATYVLQLVDDPAYPLPASPALPGKPLILTVLNMDGLVAGTVPANTHDLHVGVQLSQLLLLPAGRDEVFVPNVAGTQTRHMILQTAGITTGASGDPWPPINLAHVVMLPYGNTASPMPADAALTANSPLQIPLDVTLPSGAPGAAAAASAITPATAAVPPACVLLPAGARRRITYSENTSTGAFYLKSEVVMPNGPSQPAARSGRQPSRWRPWAGICRKLRMFAQA